MDVPPAALHPAGLGQTLATTAPSVAATARACWPLAAGATTLEDAAHVVAEAANVNSAANDASAVRMRMQRMVAAMGRERNGEDR